MSSIMTLGMQFLNQMGVLSQFQYFITAILFIILIAVFVRFMSRG